jgi:hypothetical protein
MIDLRRLLSGLVQAIGAELPDVAVLKSALDLDLSQSRVVETKSALAIHDARLLPHDIAADIVWGLPPDDKIIVLTRNSSLPYRQIKDEMFGAHQRTNPSKLSPGFGVLFEMGDLTCGYTVDSPDADVSMIFCEVTKAQTPSARQMFI